MTLSIYQKSVYLIIFNATMIARSIGKIIKKNSGRKTLNDFRNNVFKEIEKLTQLIDSGKLKEKHLFETMDNISKKFNISYGQAQKPINVILKFHFYLTKNTNKNIKKVLHCPIDSIILKFIKRSSWTLSKIEKEKYKEFQELIEKQSSCKVEFDIQWDKQHLERAGIKADMVSA